MYKTSTSIDELAESMRRELFKDDAEKVVAETKINEAVTLIVTAADLLDDIGLDKEAEVVTKLLENINV